MLKILFSVLAVFVSVFVMARGSVAELVKNVPDGTNVLMYVNTAKLFRTSFMDKLREQDDQLNYMVDGVLYHEEQLGLEGEVVSSLVLCRDTTKATASFVLVNTKINEDKFKDVFVADYAYFNTAEEKEIQFGPRHAMVKYFELARKANPEQLYSAVYIAEDTVAVVPADYLLNTLKALQNPPIKDEVSLVVEQSVNKNTVGIIVASLNPKKGSNLIPWDKSLDGLTFVEILFELVGEQEDIEITARFYASSSLSSATDQAIVVSEFADVLRLAKTKWLDSVFGFENDELRNKVSDCIRVTIRGGRINLEVKMPQELYAQLNEFSPQATIDLFSGVCEMLQLQDPQ